MSAETSHTPTAELRKTAANPLPELRGGFVARLGYCYACWQARRRRSVRQQRVKHILALMQEQTDWSDERLVAQLETNRQLLMRARMRPNPTAEDATLAIAAVLANRILRIKPYPEQILGAIGLLEGQLMEMATGEGKTLTLAIASIPAALSGRIHLVLTANDYLASRDAETMGPLYQSCGLRVGAVTSRMEPAERIQNYACDIVYTTARELVADFLRDRLQYQYLKDGDRRLIRALFQGAPMSFPGAVLHGIESVFVDEADYMLIDEAVTPLIISAPQENPLLETLVTEVFARARELQIGRDFAVHAREHRIELTAAATAQLIQNWSPRHPILQLPQRRVEWVRKALAAIHLYIREKHYLVRDEKVHIIDQSLGRILPNRTWSQGTHQFVELKEQVPLSQTTHTITGISFQNFFRMVPRLAGVSGTLSENAFECHRIYGLTVHRVPLHRADQRTIRTPHFYLEAEEKYRAAARRIGELHRTGQPILIGTLSVRASHQLARVLIQANLPYRLLNADQDHEEAAILARAGEPGAITLATNMAGRGVDIRLASGMETLGGLCVVQLERNPSRRVDRQLYGRCARQGERGCVEIFTSLDEDHLAGAHGGLRRWLASLLRQALRHPLGIRLAIAYVAHRQARSEAQAHARRIALLQRDRWLDEAIG